MIVERLHRLGDEFYNLRKNSVESTTLEKMEGERAESSKLDEAKISPALRALVKDFKADIHRLSLPKFKQRLNKASG